jgi:hypothetical protein
VRYFFVLQHASVNHRIVSLVRGHLGQLPPGADKDTIKPIAEQCCVSVADAIFELALDGGPR